MKLLTELNSLDNVKDGETRKLVTKTSTSGNGNVVSSVGISGDTITYTKGVTALTSHQKAYSNMKVGAVDVNATQAGDTFNIVAGDNVTLTPSANDKSVTIAATDTTYESKAAVSGGTAVSLVTTGEKYTWNNKQNALSSQTAYSAKGTATKVPQITTNSLGQVTKIEEVTITQPTVNNATLTIQKNGTTVKTFTANASTDVTANITVPTKTSDITNDSGFITSHQNAFSNVKVGSTTVAADVAGDTLELVAGNNITLTPDATNDKVTIAASQPTVNNGTLTIQKNGTNVQTFSANQSSNATANITVPTKVSELTNDSGYTTNTGTITGITMNGTSKGTSGVVDLGTVITDVSGKYDKAGGAMTGAITRDLGSGTIANTNLYTVTGSTDGFKVDYDSTTADVGTTKLYTTDDANAKLSFGNNVSGTYKEAISIVNGSATVTGSVSGTATKLATGRTIGIGTGATGTATSFDGSSNITIPITDVKDAYVTWGGKSIASDITPDDMGCVDEFGHNKLSYLPASCLEVKYSTDGGSTWADYGLTDTQKVAMVTTTGPNVYIGGPDITPTEENITNLRLRVRLAAGPITGGKLYTQAKKLLINYSTQGSGGNKVAIRYRTIANYKSDTDTWITVGTYDVSGGSGWNSIPFNYRFGGSFDSQTGQIGQFEFVFYCTSLGTWGVKKPCVIDFRLIGNTNWTMPSELARSGRLYTIDTSQNATFPQNVAASSFSTTGSITTSNGDVLLTKNAATGGQQVKWSTGGNDYARVYGAATASNAGYLEIATADDGNEPIYARQYTGSFGTLTRTATLLDASGNTSFPGTLTANKIDATKLDGAIPSAVTAATQTQGDNSTKIATTAYVDTALNNLPEPMVFKGSLGTGGTITSLPTAAASNEGWTYKVITAGTYASQSAKVGDTFISDGSAWVLIPSGDEPSGTVTSITIKGSSPITVDSESAITSSGTRTISHANSGVTAGTYRSVTVNATGHVTAGSNPTTLSGYGITDAKIASGVITLGNNTITPLTSSSTLDATKLSGTIPSGCYTNTTYTFDTGDSNGQIKVTPSGGTAQNVSVKGLGSAAYTASTDYATSSHTHSNIVTAGDNRTVATKPNDYSNKIIFQGLKNSSIIGSPSSDTYSYLVGLRGWSDDSGGNAHELAFNNTGIYWRKGATTSFGSWTRIDTDTKNTAGSTDTSSKIYLIGATSQAANPQTYSDNEVYATSGVLTTKSVQVGGTAATMQYNSTDKCIEFVFA